MECPICGGGYITNHTSRGEDLFECEECSFAAPLDAFADVQYVPDDEAVFYFNPDAV